MNKDIQKYIANCMLCRREKAKIQNYPLQMMEIPSRPFDKIAIELITECKTSTSGKKAHINYNRSSDWMARSISDTR